MPLINKKAIENKNRTTIGQWSVDRRRKGINKPERGYCFTMEQTSFGRMESFTHGTNRIVELNKKIDEFYTKTTQKGGFSKLCVKIKKRCYTDLLHFSTRKHNLVSFFGRIIF
jgi:hypothetical protein